MKRAFFCVSTAVVLFTTIPVLAEESAPQPKSETIEYVSFLDILPKALEIDQSIRLAEISYEAAIESAKASKSGWYPKADITLSSAEQYDVKPGGSNNGGTSPGATGANGGGSSNQRYNPTEAKIKITQKLWDFGETTATIKTSQISAEMARLGLNAAQNQSILGAARKYISLKKAFNQYKIALENETQLRQQTGIQDFRVSRGAAVGTDVLQAKNALAAAMTARVAAEGGYNRALSAFETAFGFTPDNVLALTPIRIPQSLMPSSVEEYRDAVVQNGDGIARANLAYDMAMVNEDKAFASNFLPEFKLTAEANYKGDASGTLGGKTEYIGKVELTWPIELFGTQLNSYRASKLNGRSATITYAQAKRSVEDQINSGWNSYELAALNRANVQNQVVIAEQFLRLAQIEVQQGRGQMMMVMNAQNALINARKALQDNTSDHAVQVYNLLAQMGKLTVENLEISAQKEDEARQAALEEYKKRVEEAQQKAKQSQSGENSQ